METLTTFNELANGAQADFARVFSETEYEYRPFAGGMMEGKLIQPEVPLFTTEYNPGVLESHYIGVSGLGLMEPTDFTGTIAYEDRIQTYRKDLFSQWYTKGIIVNQAELEFGKYQEKLNVLKALTISAQKTKDNLAFLGIFGADENAAFGTADGVATASTSHPRRDGGANQSNLITGTAYSESQQEVALQALAAYYDNKGTLIGASGQKVILLVPYALKKQAMIVNNGVFRSGTNNNDINIYDGNVTVIATSLIGSMNSFKFADGTTITGTDTAARFIDPGNFKPVFSVQKEPSFETHKDFDSKSVKSSLDAYYSFGAIDWRGYVKIRP